MLASNGAGAGSWGWPRPDYRLDADADDLTNHKNVACWFYAEDRFYNSPYTLALDNSNVVLASLKFSLKTVNNNEDTQLSFLNHQVAGFDHSEMAGIGVVRSDAAYGNMLRSIEIKPYYLNNGTLTVMNDAALGASSMGAPLAGGDVVPRCFDVRYTLRNLSNNQRFKFSFRSFCRTNPL